MNNTKLKIGCFNVLAPVFAKPEYYPSPVWHKLDWKYRFPKIRSVLKLIINNLDVICLHEVTDDYTETITSQDGTVSKIHRHGTYWSLKSVFGNGWDRYFIPNDINYWGHLYDTDIHSKYAKIIHGMAVFVRKKSFQKYTVVGKKLGQKGNYCAWIDSVHSTGCPIQLIGIHLDDTLSDRTIELESLKNHIRSITTPNIIVMGDYNSNAFEFLKLDTGIDFKDSLYELSVQSGFRIYNKTYSMSDCDDKYIDHIIYSGSNLLLCDKINSGYPYGYPDTTISGVIDFGLHDQFDNETTDINDENSRFFTALDLSGSDHFPIVVTFLIKK